MEGIKILHIEDFSNEIVLTPLIGNIYGTPLYSSTQSHIAVLGTLCRLETHPNKYNSSGQSTTVSGTSSAGVLELKFVRNRSDHNQNWPAWDFVLSFEIPVEHRNDRFIVSFDYIPTGTYNTGLIFCKTTSPYTGIETFTKGNLPGKLEFILESGELTIYFRGKVFYKGLFNPEHRFGIASMFPNQSYNRNFSMANLVILAVPLDHPLKRLGSARVARTLVSTVDDVPHSDTDPLNGTTPHDGSSLEIGHEVRTIAFNELEVNSGETVLGYQTAIAGINTPTGSEIETILLNGADEISSVVSTLDDTVLSRIVIGDANLGDTPEDYNDLTLKVRTVEV